MLITYLCDAIEKRWIDFLDKRLFMMTGIKHW
jgi:hypothetical protein